MQINVQITGHVDLISVDVCSNCVMSEVFRSVNKIMGTDDACDAEFGGEPIADSALLSDSGITSESTIQLRYSTEDIKWLWKVPTNDVDKRAMFRTADFAQFYETHLPSWRISNWVHNIEFNSLGNVVTIRWDDMGLKTVNWCALKRLSSLWYLNMERNELSVVDFSCFPQSLKWLDFSYNKFTSIRSSYLGNLKHLRLSHNKLLDFDFSRVQLDFPRLITLSLFDNDISVDINEQSLPRNVKSLELSDNDFSGSFNLSALPNDNTCDHISIINNRRLKVEGLDAWTSTFDFFSGQEGKRS